MEEGMYSYWRWVVRDRQKYICASCCLCIKWPLDRQYADREIQVPNCPQCKQPMRCVGFTFEPPKKRDKAAWAKLNNAR